MDLPTYLSVLRRNWLVLLLAVVLGVSAGTLVYVSTPKSYATTVDFYVSTPTSQNTNPQASGEFAESRVNSYVLLLSSEQLGQRVVAASGVDLSPLQVSRRITASAKINTVVINTVVTDESQARSLQIAQGIATSFGLLVNDLDNAGRSTPVVVIHTVSGPTVKSGPVAPDRRLYIGAGLLAGLVVGAGLALLRGARQRIVPVTQSRSEAPAPAGDDSDVPEGEVLDPAESAGGSRSGAPASEIPLSDEGVEDGTSWHWDRPSQGDDAAESLSVASKH